MWRLWNKLFGWDYVYDWFIDEWVVSRIRKSAHGYYYKPVIYMSNLIFLENKRDSKKLKFLTCDREKYLP